MCLVKVTHEFCEPLPESEGYKVFLKNSEGKYVPEFYGIDGYRYWTDDTEKKTPIPMNKKLVARKGIIPTQDYCQLYNVGFHAFISLESAQKWVSIIKEHEEKGGIEHKPRFIVKVKLGQVRLKGMQQAYSEGDMMPCYVADEMTVPSEENLNPCA